MAERTPDQTKRWSRELFFVFACVGAAVGVGNLWRFPYMAYENGGGAFLFPYIVCLLFVGVPIMLLEIGIGRWGGGSAPRAFRNVGTRWTWVGWWALANSMVILFYYAVVIGWCAQYVVFSFTEAWGQDPASFFLNDVARLTGDPFKFGGISLPSIIALAVIWGAIFLIVRSGTKGLSRVLLVTVPLPALLLVILAGRSLAMPGAVQGISYLFKPQLSKILSISVWAAAASQVVLSLSLGMGQIVAYASKKRDDSRIVRSGVTICFLDLAFSLLAGITVFATMGFLATSTGVPINELKLDGIFLAFVSYPMAISSLPLAPLWGVMFFVLLVSLGIDSAFAAVEAVVTGGEDVSPTRKRNLLAALICGIGFLGGILFTAGSGLLWLDIVDHWVAYYSIGSIIVLQCIVFGHIGPLDEIVRRIGASWHRCVGVAWRCLVSFIIPIVLTVIFGLKIIGEFSERYGDYPLPALLLGGWGALVLALTSGILLALWHNRRTRSHPSRD